jgi:hypothetical protein
VYDLVSEKGMNFELNPRTMSILEGLLADGADSLCEKALGDAVEYKDMLQEMASDINFINYLWPYLIIFTKPKKTY